MTPTSHVRALGLRAFGAGSQMSPSKSVARAAAAQRVTKRAPSARLADERLQSIIELAADFYWEQDEQFRFTAYRPSGEPDAMLDGLVGQTSWEFFDEAPETSGWAPLVATLEQHASFRDVLHCLATPTTGVRYFSFSGQPIFDQRNQFQGLSRHRASTSARRFAPTGSRVSSTRLRTRSPKPTT